MKTANIRINTIEDVKNFVTTVTKCNYEVDIVSGRYAIDAKSIMGIFSRIFQSPSSFVFTAMIAMSLWLNLTSISLSNL